MRAMHIHQLNVSHNEREDRVLLRLNTQAGEEFRFWLTRRMANNLLPALHQVVAKMESRQPQVVAPTPAAEHILGDLKREAFLQTADFSTPFVQAVQTLPMGPAPMLLTEVQMTLQGTGLVMVLQDKGDGTSTQGTPSCELKLQANLVHGLIHLLTQAMAQAHWQTPAITSAPAAAALPSPEAYSGYKH